MSEKHDRIKDAAEAGYSAFVKLDVGKDFLPHRDKPTKKGEPMQVEPIPFKELDGLQKAGLYAMVAGIVENPLAEPHAGFMPANNDRKACRALDDCLRDALGYARFDHQ